MVLKSILKEYIQKGVTAIKSTIKPPALVYPKDRFPRDENYYHYRYPSPASEEIYKPDEGAYDYRLGYKDSIHEIRSFEHDPLSKEDGEEFFLYQPSRNDGERRKGRLIRS